MGFNSVTDVAPQEIYRYLAHPTWAFKVAQHPFADCLSLAQVRQQPVELALNNAVAFAGTGFQARTIEHLDASAAVVDQSASWSVPAAAVTPSRRTPSMSAIICCVTLSSFDGVRSISISNQRHNCLLSEW